MSPPQVSGLVAMAMPQQKEACVWGPVLGRRGGQGKRREGALLRAAHCALQSVSSQREEERKSSQRHKTGLDCLASVPTPIVTLKMSLIY